MSITTSKEYRDWNYKFEKSPLDSLIEKDVFPEDFDREDIINFLARYAYQNIEDVKGWFPDE